MNTSASSTSFSTGSKISKNSNEQVMLPLEKDQECQEPNTVLETIPSTLTEGSTDLQTVGHAELTSMGSLPETRAHNIMKKDMTQQLYIYCQELIECDWTLELMKQDQASIREGTATKYNKEWWANISLKMCSKTKYQKVKSRKTLS